MRRLFVLIMLTEIFAGSNNIMAATENPQVVAEFLDRIGGNGMSERMATLLDESLKRDGNDVFVITSADFKPQIQGSSISAITTGIGWYLNHYLHVNLAWNNGLAADLSGYTLVVPDSAEMHVCNADYRYYLNYCTFGYSMTTWTWERWQHEIDWMALHGINMPLQIVGMEQVWKSLLMDDCGYSEAEAEAFVPGPAYIAWWGMNNLQGWGGDGTDETTGMKDNAWYDRQVGLARKIIDREKSLGMQPVLPGFSGMVPAGFPNSISQGTWCAFTRPAILDPTSETFQTVAANYYKQLEKVMGKSRYYSMDPFHEGTAYKGDFAAAYQNIYQAMNANCGDDTRWVIQQWIWSRNQRLALTNVPDGRLIVLDLFSDGNPKFDAFDGYTPQEAVYCTIPNFGGRTGMFGRLAKMASNYFTYKDKYVTIKGIGTAPEAIEQTPVAYDLLFELPWMTSAPDTKEWIKDYATARYGVANDDANTAWEDLRGSCLDNNTTVQGPHEAVVCARPALEVASVSTWGSCDVFYDKDKVVDAAFTLLGMGEPADAVGKQNYSYDLTDVTRQALTDYAQTLLASIKEYSADVTSIEFTQRRDAFLGLILDIDRLLASNRLFRLGNWTQTARDAAKEVEGATTATADWYELNNARQLITTWGDKAACEDGGLCDYSYREWQGLLKDFYYKRWKYWFDNGMKVPESWFCSEWNWAHETEGEWGAETKGKTASAKKRTYYSPEPEGNTYEIAKELLGKYFRRVEGKDGKVGYKHFLIDYVPMATVRKR